MTGGLTQSFEIDGTYEILYENDQVIQRQNQPVWKHTTKAYFLFVGKNGLWLISDETDFDEDNSWSIVQKTSFDAASPCPYNDIQFGSWYHNGGTRSSDLDKPKKASFHSFLVDEVPESEFFLWSNDFSSS